MFLRGFLAGILLLTLGSEAQAQFLFFVKRNMEAELPGNLARPEISSSQTNIYLLRNPPPVRGRDNFAYYMDTFESLDVLLSEPVVESTSDPLVASLGLMTGNLEERLASVPALIKILSSEVEATNLPGLDKVLESAKALLYELVELYQLRTSEGISVGVRKHWSTQLAKVDELYFKLLEIRFAGKPRQLIRQYSPFFRSSILTSQWTQSAKRAHLLVQAQIAEFESESTLSIETLSFGVGGYYFSAIAETKSEDPNLKNITLDSDRAAELWPLSFYLLGSKNAEVRTLALQQFMQFARKREGDRPLVSGLGEAASNGHIFNHENWLARMISQADLADMPADFDKSAFNSNCLKLLSELLSQSESTGHRTLYWASGIELLTRLRAEGWTNRTEVPPEFALLRLLAENEVSDILPPEKSDLILELTEVFVPAGFCRDVFGPGERVH